MSKVNLPYYHRPAIAEVARRRGQSLRAWAQDVGIRNPAQLELYCRQHKLAVPSGDEMIQMFDPIVDQHVVVEVVQPVVVPVVETLVSDDEPEKKPKRKKNALVKLVEGDESSPEALEKPSTEE